MKTLCTQCDKVLTDDQGRRLHSANFPGNRATKPMTPEITYAYCDECLGTPALLDMIRETRRQLSILRQYPTDYKRHLVVDRLLMRVIQEIQARS